MKPLVKKTGKLGLLKLELVLGALIMAAALLALPIGIFVYDASLMANPYLLGTVGVGMLFFGLVGFFGFIRPYFQCKKTPDVLVETDGKYLYIHVKKEAKIRLSELTEASVDVDLPYLLDKEFLKEFLIHLFSEEYGTLILRLEGYGKFKLRYVSRASDTANELIHFLDRAMNH